MQTEDAVGSDLGGSIHDNSATCPTPLAVRGTRGGCGQGKSEDEERKCTIAGVERFFRC